MINSTNMPSTYHLCNSSVSEDVACMDEAVQHLGCLLDQVTLVGVVFQLFICKEESSATLKTRTLLSEEYLLLKKERQISGRI